MFALWPAYLLWSIQYNIEGEKTMKWPKRKNWYEKIKNPTAENAYLRLWELILEEKLPLPKEEEQ